MRHQRIALPHCCTDQGVYLLDLWQRLIQARSVNRVDSNRDEVVRGGNNQAQSAQWHVPLPVSVKVLPASGMNVQS